MSGICGILHRDGQPVERSLLAKMTAYLDYRGPDGREVWLNESVGLGHTLLRTTDESCHKRQPYSLDGRVYLTADARLDGREELIALLQGKGCEVKPEEPDGMLILHAYHAWGENCLQYLLGDFAFAIWDGRGQHLFCARDPFGIKLFYYAQIGNCFVFSNTLNCLRLHPQVSDRLNERAIGDFLLFDMNYERDTTVFTDIQNLPGGHQLVVREGTARSRSYWTLPKPQQIRYRQEADYIAHFQEVMERAVCDRLRTENIAILFSGGLDSTTLATTAVEAAKHHQFPLNLQAFTVVYDRLMSDREGYYSGMAAQTLNLPQHHLVADDYRLYQGWNGQQLQPPEPLNAPLALITRHHLQQIASHSRVALYGQGGDEGFRPGTVAEMLQGMPLNHVAIDLVRCLLLYRLKPAWGTGLLGTLRRWRGLQPQRSSPPEWLNADFARRLDLGQRWEQQYRPALTLTHPPRSRAYEDLPPTPLWNLNFVVYDPGVSGIPVEVRLPFLDLRLLDYLLALPPLPWCVNKYLLRSYLRPHMPPALWQRPKTPLPADPVYLHIQAGQTPWQELELSSLLKEYIDLPCWQKALSCKMSSWQAWRNLRPIGLNHWLEQYKSIPEI